MPGDGHEREREEKGGGDRSGPKHRHTYFIGCARKERNDGFACVELAARRTHEEFGQVLRTARPRVAPAGDGVFYDAGACGATRERRARNGGAVGGAIAGSGVTAGLAAQPAFLAQNAPVCAKDKTSPRFVPASTTGPPSNGTTGSVVPLISRTETARCGWQFGYPRPASAPKRARSPRTDSLGCTRGSSKTPHRSKNPLHTGVPDRSNSVAPARSRVRPRRPGRRGLSR